MAVVDRTILRWRCSSFSPPDIPPKVTINEYIEIAKNSARGLRSLRHGLLDRISREHGTLPERVADVPDLVR